MELTRIGRRTVARRKRRPEPEPVDARPPRWLLFGSIGLVVLLIGPPVASLVTGDGNARMLGLALWPVLVLPLIWRSRLVVDRDGVAFTFLGTRHVPWSEIEAMVPTSAAFGLRGPHLRVRGGRPVPLNPLWRADGRPVPVAVEPWARRKRVRIEGEVDAATRGRSQALTIVVLVGVGALVGLLIARLTVG
ncbi:MAG TPA: hypothetical protein VK923_14730 [Euzebyales bacterium]|nr:hypothetical protein [Euzebyales bacterium]